MSSCLGVCFLNEEYYSKGLSHQNWYIFSDTGPITKVGLKFFFKDRNILKALNEQIRKFNKANGVEFYVKLSGLRALEYEEVKEILGLGIISKFFGKETPAETPLSRELAQGLNNYYQKINKATENKLKQAKKEELELSSDIYSTSKLGKYGAILSITKYYFYHYKEGASKTLYAQFAKSLALGRGFNESFMEFLEDEEYYDVYQNKVKSLALSINKMQLEYKNAGNPDLGEFRFSQDPDKALENHLNLVEYYLTNQKQVNAKGGHNVIYLVNVTGNFKGLNATQTQEELRKITIEANKYFQTLQVKTRAALYTGKPEDFRFDLLGSREGVAFIGGHNTSDATDLIKAIENLAKPKSGEVSKEHRVNGVFADTLKRNYKFDYQNPEASSIALRDGYNRIVIHYGRSKNPSTIADYGAAKTTSTLSGTSVIAVVDKSEVHIAHIRVCAYNLVHGVGHNAELSSGRNKAWNHYGGVMADGNENQQAGRLIKRIQPDYLRKYILNDDKKERMVWISTQSTDIIKKVSEVSSGLSKRGYTYKELEYQTILSKNIYQINNNSMRKIIIRDFVFNSQFTRSAVYEQFIKMYPSILPNHAYKYSIERHFGKLNAKANTLLGKIILQ